MQVGPFSALYGESPRFGSQNPFREGIRFAGDVTLADNGTHAVYIKLSPSIQWWINRAREVARTLGATEVKPVHLATAMIETVTKHKQVVNDGARDLPVLEKARFFRKRIKKRGEDGLAEDEKVFLATIDALIPPAILQELHSHTSTGILENALERLAQQNTAKMFEQFGLGDLDINNPDSIPILGQKQAERVEGKSEDTGKPWWKSPLRRLGWRRGGEPTAEKPLLLLPGELEARKEVLKFYTDVDKTPLSNELQGLLTDFLAQHESEPTPEQFLTFVRELPDGSGLEDLRDAFRTIRTEAQGALERTMAEKLTTAREVEEIWNPPKPQAEGAEKKENQPPADPSDRFGWLAYRLRDLQERSLMSPDELQGAQHLLRDLKNESSDQNADIKMRRAEIYLDRLPWNKSEEKPFDPVAIRQVLDEDHYGMDRIKDRVLEILAVQERRRREGLSEEGEPRILCMVGGAGVGKTSIVRSVAKAMNRDYERIALGGENNEEFIRGGLPVHVASEPSEVIKALTRVKTKNPVIVLDEVDKAGPAVQSALLNLLDPEQNKVFRDNYLGLPFDLSDVTFVLTANSLSTMSGPLRDRMEVVKMPSYTPEEKRVIARDYMLPKIRKDHKLSEEDFRVSADNLMKIIRGYTHEGGLRQLKLLLTKLADKRVYQIEAQTAEQDAEMTPEVYERDNWLGPPRPIYNKVEASQVGRVNGAYYSEVGGGLIPMVVEVREDKTREGPPEFNVTQVGNLGKTTPESLKTVWAYVKNYGQEHGVNLKRNMRYDVTIGPEDHAQPVDGSSAGAAFTVGLISELTHRPVRGDIAMTGTLTLKGRVGMIGGVREKLVGAYLAGVKTFYISDQNTNERGDLVDGDGSVVRLPEEVTDAMKIVPVTHIREILDNVLLPAETGEQDETPALSVRTLRPEQPPQIGWASASTAYAQAGGEILPVLVELFEQPVDGPSDLKLEPLTEPLKGALEQQANNALVYVKKLLMARKVPNRQLGSNTLLNFNVSTKGDDPVGKGSGVGMAVAAAMLSELTGIPVRHDVVAIGGLDTKGNIEPVKDLAEQVKAAVKAGAETVLIPAANQGALKGLPEEVRSAAIPVSRFEEAAHMLFERDLDVSRTHHFDLTGNLRPMPQLVRNANGHGDGRRVFNG